MTVISSAFFYSLVYFYFFISMQWKQHVQCTNTPSWPSWPVELYLPRIIQCIKLICFNQRFFTFVHQMSFSTYCKLGLKCNVFKDVCFLMYSVIRLRWPVCSCVLDAMKRNKSSWAVHKIASNEKDFTVTVAGRHYLRTGFYYLDSLLKSLSSETLLWANLP